MRIHTAVLQKKGIIGGGMYQKLVIREADACIGRVTCKKDNRERSP